MDWSRIVFDVSDVLSLALIVRLFSLRLHSAYRVFCAFLLFQVVSESFVIVLRKFPALNAAVDYRVAWLVMAVTGWVLSLWMVYALLQDILRKLPGILRFSQRVLSIIIPLALLIALLTVRSEYLAAGAGSASNIGYFVRVAVVMERIVATVALLSLLLMLLFIFWFPVTLPRNLAVFSVGFVVYFTAKTVLLLIRSFWAHENFDLLNDGVTLILCICLAYWITFLNKRGEAVPVTMGHVWQVSKQTKLVNDLEHLNAVLARAGRR